MQGEKKLSKLYMGAITCQFTKKNIQIPVSTCKAAILIYIGSCDTRLFLLAALNILRPVSGGDRPT